MTSGNLLPVGLLVLFLASGVNSIPPADLHVVLVTLSDPSDSIGHLSDAFESSLHLRGFAEDAQSSLLQLTDRYRVVVESIRVRMVTKNDQ